MLRIGIIGTGVMGAGHARFIKEHVPGAKVVALFDIDAKKIAELAAELGTVTVQTTDAETLMNHPEVDAVIIASPDPLHVAHLKLAIACKKPILCEKPIATTLEDAREIAQEIRDYESDSGKTMIHFGFMRRFDPAYREVRRLIETGNYGKPTFFRTITRNVASTGATTPGLFTNIAIHDFDIFRWLFKDEWVSVQSHYPRKSSLSPEGIADPLVITAFMKSGIMMVADIVAFNNYGYDVRAEVICEKGSIEIGINGDVVTRSNHVMGAHTGGKMEENWIPRFTQSYIEELRAWVGTITSGIENLDLATVEDALAANEVCALGVASI
ncbi:MAG: myo-inositol 2-dehydrogenase [Streptomycetaceae bacterium]|nr:MAG: myo-inositol 2-dehydrogenase [Streptomycetaceae bacterium]